MAEWYPFLQALGLVFFSLQRENKKVLEQLVIETNSKIKVKHLWDKVNQWKKMEFDLYKYDSYAIFLNADLHNKSSITPCLTLIRFRGSYYDKAS